jgi:hypothetical protein
VEQSILKSTKKVLGLPDTLDAYDQDVLTLINSAFSNLLQIGIGPPEGFSIEDEAPVWDDFITPGPVLNSVKAYIYLKVKYAFDPPNTSFLLAATSDQIDELEWRLRSFGEED